jgi:uncharacterized protein (TIGR00290 family)
VAFHWSGGKDSAHALGRLLVDERYDVRCLVTAVDGSRDESSVHGLPHHLLGAQADAIGLPLQLIGLSDAGLGDYADAMETATRRWREAGIRAVGFGDLDYSGAARYREKQFGSWGMEVVEPLHGMSSATCVEEFLVSGIEAVTVVVDAGVLGREHLGVPVDAEFVASLPAGCDPCGEDGEYHTFVGNAPYFAAPVAFTPGRAESIERRIGTSGGLKTFGYWRLPLE